MPIMVLNREITESILEQRRALGNRTRDEVWDGVTYIMPEPGNEHEQIALFFGSAFYQALCMGTSNVVQGTANISDQVIDWTDNYRNPDMAYFSADCAAIDHGSFWYGGPDFLLEIISPDDMSRDKLPFYASVGTREVLILDRDPWQLELHQLRRGKLHLVGAAKAGDGKALASNVVPLTFALVRGKPRPKIRITHTESDQKWTF